MAEKGILSTKQMAEKGIFSTKQNGWKWNYYPLNKMAENGITIH